MAGSVITPGPGGSFDGERCPDCDRVLLPVAGGWGCRGCGQVWHPLTPAAVASVFGIGAAPTPAARSDSGPGPADTGDQPELNG